MYKRKEYFSNLSDYKRLPRNPRYIPFPPPTGNNDEGGSLFRSGERIGDVVIVHARDEEPEDHVDIPTLLQVREDIANYCSILYRVCGSLTRLSGAADGETDLETDGYRIMGAVYNIETAGTALLGKDGSAITVRAGDNVVFVKDEDHPYAEGKGGYWDVLAGSHVAMSNLEIQAAIARINNA